RTSEHGRARRDLELLVVDGHLSFSAEDVIDLVLVLLVVADARTGMEGALPEHEGHLRHLREKRVADRHAAAIVRARFVPGDLGVTLDHIAARLLLSNHPAEPEAEDKRHDHTNGSRL